MGVISIDDVIDFFDRLNAKEAEVREFLLQPEVRLVAGARKQAELFPFFDAKPKDVIETLQRPMQDVEPWIAKQREMDAGPRTVFALEQATVDGVDVVLAYTNNFERKVDNGMWNRFTVAPVESRWRKPELKIVARYVRCGDCTTKASLAMGDGPDATATLEGCGYCKRQGWSFAGGYEHNKPKSGGDARKLTEPEHRFSRALWATLPG